MENLTGAKIKKLDFNITKRGDLISFEGPLLSHFFGDYGENYLFYWVDCDDIVNRWLLFKVSEIDFYDYFNKTKSLRDLIITNENELIFFIDIDTDIEYKNIIVTNKLDVPLSYFPDLESYFEENISTKYAIKLKTEIFNIMSRYNISKNEIQLRNFEKNLDDINILQTLHNLRNINSRKNINNLLSSKLPLLILEEYFRDNNSKWTKFLVYKSQKAFINPITYDSYFYQLNNFIHSKFDYMIPIDDESDFNETLILKNLYNITFNIVSENPTRFEKYIELWKTSLQEEDDENSKRINEKLNEIKN